MKFTEGFFVIAKNPPTMQFTYAVGEELLRPFTYCRTHLSDILWRDWHTAKKCQKKDVIFLFQYQTEAQFANFKHNLAWFNAWQEHLEYEEATILDTEPVFEVNGQVIPSRNIVAIWLDQRWYRRGQFPNTFVTFIIKCMFQTKEFTQPFNYEKFKATLSTGERGLAITMGEKYFLWLLNHVHEVEAPSVWGSKADDFTTHHINSGFIAKKNHFASKYNFQALTQLRAQ